MLDDVTLKELLDFILKAGGPCYIIEGDTIVIVESETDYFHGE